MRKINHSAARPVRVPDGYRLATHFAEIDAAQQVANREHRVSDPARMCLRIRYQGQWLPAKMDVSIRTRRAPQPGTAPTRVGVYVCGLDFPARRVPAGEIAIPDVDGGA